jgi:hypothetical protein
MPHLNITPVKRVQGILNGGKHVDWWYLVRKEGRKGYLDIDVATESG